MASCIFGGRTVLNRFIEMIMWALTLIGMICLAVELVVLVIRLIQVYGGMI